MTEAGPTRSISSFEVRMLTSATLWRKGSARQPPSSTTFCPPRPVRTRAILAVGLRVEPVEEPDPDHQDDDEDDREDEPTHWRPPLPPRQRADARPPSGSGSG